MINIEIHIPTRVPHAPERTGAYVATVALPDTPHINLPVSVEQATVIARDFIARYSNHGLLRMGIESALKDLNGLPAAEMSVGMARSVARLRTLLSSVIVACDPTQRIEDLLGMAGSMLKSPAASVDQQPEHDGTDPLVDVWDYAKVGFCHTPQRAHALAIRFSEAIPDAGEREYLLPALLKGQTVQVGGGAAPVFHIHLARQDSVSRLQQEG